jgi:hypothetical protein
MKTVITKCVSCNEKREIKAGEVPPGEHPMCEKCFMPMVPVEALAK